MSNSFTVRLTARRSSARSAPISYTPPVTPPPPSTSAVRDWLARRRGTLLPAAVRRAGFSSLTTLPMCTAIIPERAAGQPLPSRPVSGRPAGSTPAAAVRALLVVVLAALAAAPAPAVAAAGSTAPTSGGEGARAAHAATARAGARWVTAARTAEDRGLRRTLAGAMRSAGSSSGAYAYNATEGRTLFTAQADTRRILASNTKLFTTAAVLGRRGARQRIETRVIGAGRLDERGRWHGSLYLRGGGDPTFGSEAFARRSYLASASVESLARRLRGYGIRSVSGRVVGDESLFDSRRGGPASGFRTSIYVGPLSALAYDRGLANDRGTAFQSDPPLFAAARLDQELEQRGVRVAGSPAAGSSPEEAHELVAVRSPTVARLVQIANTRSDNFFAEILLKGLGALEVGDGTTAAGARRAEAFARTVGASASLADGSGLSRRNVAAPRQVGRLLTGLRRRDEFPAFLDSLAIAGRTGTLLDRLRSGPARGRCRAKTGTLSDVSALSGYCESLGGDTIVFSILMNRVSVSGARTLQDRMAQAMAGYRG